MMKSTDQMIKYFLGVESRPLYVSTDIRNTWLLNRMTFTKREFAYDIRFRDMGGGVWLAEYFMINPPYDMEVLSRTMAKWYKDNL